MNDLLRRLEVAIEEVGYECHQRDIAEGIAEIKRLTLIWDKRPPSVPGYYWIRTSGNPGMTLDWVDPRQAKEGAEYAGPIPAPVEPAQ